MSENDSVQQSNGVGVDPVTPFRRRFQSIVEGPLLTYRDQFRQSDDQQQQALAQIIGDFLSFAHAYFNYFTTSCDSDQHRRDLAFVLKRLQREAELLLRASQQRLRPSAYQPYLQHADQRALRIYAQFTGFKPCANVVPIIYVEKLFSIRRCLYSNRGVPLLAIQMLTLKDPDQQEGIIAHEMGHFIYWNTSQLGAFPKIQQQVEQAVLKVFTRDQESFAALNTQVKAAKFWIGWIEEIIADIFATLMAGPRYVVSSLKRIADEGDYLTSSDPTHPCTYLRPLIALEALAWIVDSKKGDKAHLKILGELIAQFSQQCKKMVKLARKEKDTRIEVRVRDLEHWVQPIVRAILDSPSGWVDVDGVHPTSVGELFNYSAWLDQMRDVALPMLDNQDQPFDYAGWFTVLPSLKDVEADSGVLGTALEVHAGDDLATQNPPSDWSLPPTSPEFEDLKRHFERTYGGSATKVRNALLQLDIGDERGAWGPSTGVFEYEYDVWRTSTGVFEYVGEYNGNYTKVG